jgi:pimeloyl-ACP methyl ester carboxylesterase|tara:strand:+ start:2068 stop:2835 length:768 start_codon:yes stop_codon:yes gene_type:complete
MQDHCHNWDWTSEALCNDYHILSPDLRGHGDSDWSKGSSYSNLDYVYDIAQLIEQQDLDSVHLVGHSLGGTVASLYAGLFPERVASLISIEGVGGFWWQEIANMPAQKRIRDFFDATRSQAGRTHRRYESLEAAHARMQESNPHLSPERAKHLTIHGSIKNEDGTYSWKFDNYTHTGMISNFSYKDMVQIWTLVTCPVLLINATEGFEHRIGHDGSETYFSNHTIETIPNAGHWLHHDQFERCVELISAFLKQHA